MRLTVRVILTALLVIAVIPITQPAIQGAGAGRAEAIEYNIRALQFNACDQYQASSNMEPDCHNKGVSARAQEIANTIKNYA